jgi:hypothetical protein
VLIGTGGSGGLAFHLEGRITYRVLVPEWLSEEDRAFSLVEQLYRALHLPTAIEESAELPSGATFTVRAWRGTGWYGDGDRFAEAFLGPVN